MNIVTASASGEQRIHAVSYRSGQPISETWYTAHSSGSSGMTKPDLPIINSREADGYRKPSNYSVQRWQPPVVKLEFGGVFMYSSGAYEEINSNYGACSGAVILPTIAKLNPNHVRTKLLNNVRQEILDVAMVLAELQGTVTTLVGNLHRVGRSLAAVKKDKPRHFYYLLTGKTRDGRRPTDKFLRESSGVYLEWKYGINPTLMDIAGACEGLDMNAKGTLFDNPPMLVGRATDSSITRRSDSVIRFRHYGGSQPQVGCDVEFSQQLHARIDYTVSGEGLRGLNRYGIGLSSVPTVLWDKTPFSFVLNMVIPISDIIKAWTALEGCTVRGYCETQYQKPTVLPFSNRKYPGGAFLNGEGTVSLPSKVDLQPSFTRTAFNTVPFPVPYVKNPIKPGNLATVLALFTTLRRPDAK